MIISKHAFSLKYHTKQKNLIEQRRLEYVERYGYEKAKPLSYNGLRDLEYLDSIECLLCETRQRIDMAMQDPVFQDVTGWTKSAIDDKEERLVPLLCLMDRLQLQISFAVARLARFVENSTACIANWAKCLLSMCNSLRDEYWCKANHLHQAMALQLGVRN